MNRYHQIVATLVLVLLSGGAFFSARTFPAFPDTETVQISARVLPPPAPSMGSSLSSSARTSSAQSSSEPSAGSSESPKETGEAEVTETPSSSAETPSEPSSVVSPSPTVTAPTETSSKKTEATHEEAAQAIPLRPAAPERIRTAPVPRGGLLLSGKGYANEQVHLLRSGSEIGVTTAKPDGSFDFEINSIPEGTAIFQVYSEEKTHGQSPVTHFAMRISEGMIREKRDLAIPPTMELESEQFKKGEPIRITGRSTPNAVIYIRIVGKKARIFRVKADDHGYYAYTVSTNGFTVGSYSIKVRMETGNNLISEFAPPVSFRIIHGKTASILRQENEIRKPVTFKTLRAQRAQFLSANTTIPPMEKRKADLEGIKTGIAILAPLMIFAGIFIWVRRYRRY